MRTRHRHLAGDLATRLGLREDVRAALLQMFERWDGCGDPARELIGALLHHNPEFTQLWDEHEVALPAEAHKRIAHPTIGVIELDCLILTADNQTEKLVIFTATPGSEDAERLALLRVIGTERFTTLAEVDATAGD